MKLIYCKLILFCCLSKVYCQDCIFELSNGTVLQDDDTEFGFNFNKIENVSSVNKNILKLFIYTKDVISLTITFECTTGNPIIIAKKSGTEETTIVTAKLSDDSIINLDNNCDNYYENFIIIILIILLFIVSIVLVISIIKNIRNKNLVVKKNIINEDESKPEMKEISRASSISNNSQPRRSVTFVDEINEINIARL